jgi:hypothetical protein
MSDVFNAVEINAADTEKIAAHLDKIRKAQGDTAELTTAVHAAMQEFRQYFLHYGEPSFTAHELHTNETPESQIYNENLESLIADLEALYRSAAAAAAASLTSYNYASVVSTEIKNAAEASASKVLDLSILSNFTKGTTIVAGDDFVNFDKVDQDHPVETTRAQLIEGASAVGLSPISVVQVSDPGTKIGITPIMPSNAGGVVQVSPTPENLERFYEGRFYAPIGQMVPEGGQLKMTYIVDATDLPSAVTSQSVNGAAEEFTIFDPDGGQTTTDAAGAADAAQPSPGFYAVVQATDEEKAVIRSKMVDNNPDTWWECEYVFKTPPLIDFDIVADEDTDEDAEALGEGGQVQISLSAAEQVAKQYDFSGRDLMVHVDYDFGSAKPVNFVTLDPVLFGTQAFTEITDVATLNEDGEFVTVDGFDSQQFDKILTPEANKVVSDDLVKTTLAPSNFAYGGLGVFSFPVRITSKLRVTLLMRDPVPSPYERQYVLTQEVVTDTTTVTSTKKSLW